MMNPALVDTLRLDMSGGRTVMDQITESLLNEFCSEYDLENLTEGKKFEHFSTHLIVGREQSDTFDTEDFVVGDGDSKSGGDTGIDAIAVIVNGSLVSDLDELEEQAALAGFLDVQFIFIQSETSSNFDGAKILTFGSGVTDFFRPIPQLKRNERVQEAATIRQAIYAKTSKFKRGNPICKMFYVTTGKVVPDTTMDARISVVRDDLEATGLFRSIEFERLGKDDVQRLYQRARNSISATFDFTKRVTVLAGIDGVSQAYSGYLLWSQFKKLIVSESGNLQKSLFFDNVRDWQGNNDVNNEIRDTLRSPNKNRFVLMNNGITVIAKSMQLTGDEFTLEDYQIVNGCQTSHVLYEEREHIDDSVLIPFRLIGTKDEVVTNAIIRATNRQTQVTEEQFFALEEFGKTLELFFTSYPPAQRLYFERRSNQYGLLNLEKTRIVTFANMIRAFASMFLNEPHRATRNYQGLKNKVGKEIFASNQRMEPYYVAAFAIYKTDFLFRNGHLEPKYKPAKFHIILAFRILVGGYDMPAMTANKMEGYCGILSNILQDATKCVELLTKAAKIVEEVAGSKFDRDTIRTEPFTEAVINLSREQAVTQ